MSKKHFIALADALKRTRPTGDEAGGDGGAHDQWEVDRDMLADFCKSQNPAFNRERWLSYIAGECGPNGGKVGK